jgi:hypothetical protein
MFKKQQQQAATDLEQSWQCPQFCTGFALCPTMFKFQGHLKPWPTEFKPWPTHVEPWPTNCFKSLS